MAPRLWEVGPVGIHALQVALTLTVGAFVAALIAAVRDDG